MGLRENERLERIHLIQRVKEREVPQAGKGVDRYFTMEYMGAAEFEYGALPDALRSMRADESMPEWKPVRVQAGPHICWYVGPASEQVLAEDLFISELVQNQAKPSYLKERTHICEAYLNTRKPETVGWWRVDGGDPRWILFKTEQQAKKWLAGLRNQEWDKP